ncbi:MAG: hypothetical protein KGM42_14130 [Hyphomicrobiales bacterium]|nr:hypothetical protein [Hyphomicrobiales bacterium]
MARTIFTTPAAIGRACALAIVGLALMTGSAPAQDKPADGAQAAPAKHMRHARRHGDKASAPARSLEARHAVCLAFIHRHGLSCDPWTEPTCGAETGYFRPLECIRPRSQQ